MSSLLDRNDALLDWALEAQLAGTLPPEQAAYVEKHLQTNANDRRRFEALKDHQHHFRLPPRRRRGPPWRQVGAVLALVAAVLFVILGQGAGVLVEEPDSWQVKGTGERLELEAWLEQPGGDVRLRTGDQVPPGVRVAFRSGGDRGFLLLVGIDDTHTPYPAFAGDGKAIMVPDRASPEPLGTALRFDDRPGYERLIGIQCPRAFTLSGLAPRLIEASRTTPRSRDLPLLAKGCSQAEIRLVKDVP